MLVDTTEMDPIVFATTFEDVEKKAVRQNLILVVNKNAYAHLELRDVYTNHLVNAFTSILDAENWLGN